MADAKHTSPAGVELSLRIGQRVRHRDHQGQRVTGVVRGMSIEDERGLVVTVLLDEPIVIPATSEGDREIRIHSQNVDAHELSPFDERDELIAEMLAALIELRDRCIEVKSALDVGIAEGDPVHPQSARLTWPLSTAGLAIAKATGSAV